MFTLYHIPKRKEWGCTKDLNARLKKLGYTLDDLFETLKVDDKNTASYLERELNIMYGYGWNPSKDYRRVTEMGIKGAKKGGDANKESGWIYEIQRRSVIARTGTKHSEETKKKIAQKSIGRVSSRRIAVEVFDKKTLNFVGEYPSITDACNKLNIGICNATSHLKGRLNSVNGYIMKYKL